jgi:DNA-directed RNA polymerase specialized sigma24 family protein
MGRSEEEFERFVAEKGPSLQRALVARFGWADGHNAAAEALAFALEHQLELSQMDNPVGYLYRVGANRTQKQRKRRALFPAPAGDEPWFEPGLSAALGTLSERQRVAVVLIHGYGWSSAEVADLTGLTRSTVQTHLERGLRRLRTALKVKGRENV